VVSLPSGNLFGNPRASYQPVLRTIGPSGGDVCYVINRNKTIYQQGAFFGDNLTVNITFRALLPGESLTTASFQSLVTDDFEKFNSTINPISAIQGFPPGTSTFVYLTRTSSITLSGVNTTSLVQTFQDYNVNQGLTTTLNYIFPSISLTQQQQVSAITPIQTLGTITGFFSFLITFLSHLDHWILRPIVSGDGVVASVWAH